MSKNKMKKVISVGGHQVIKMQFNNGTIVTRIYKHGELFKTYTKKDNVLKIFTPINNCNTCVNKRTDNGLCYKPECDYVPNRGAIGIR